MNREDFNNFQIFNGTGTAVTEKPMTNSKLDKVSKANADTLEHYKQRQEAKKKTANMIQQLKADVEKGKAYSKLLTDALTIIEYTTGERVLPNQIKEAVYSRETRDLTRLAKRHHEEPSKEGKAVIEECFDLKRSELNQRENRRE